MISRIHVIGFGIAALLLLMSSSTSDAAPRVKGKDPAERDAAAAVAGSRASLPHNIVAPAVLRPLMLSMLNRSATFRRQCRVIADSPAVVEIRLVPRYVVGRDRALSTVKKYQYGFMTVLVQIAAPCNCEELIGHEFEHVVEQIEGLDLPNLVTRKGTGVSVDEDGAFETERARKTGQSVADEFKETQPQGGAVPVLIKR